MSGNSQEESSPKPNESSSVKQGSPQTTQGGADLQSSLLEAASSLADLSSIIQLVRANNQVNTTSTSTTSSTGGIQQSVVDPVLPRTSATTAIPQSSASSHGSPASQLQILSALSSSGVDVASLMQPDLLIREAGTKRKSPSYEPPPMQSPTRGYMQPLQSYLHEKDMSQFLLGKFGDIKGMESEASSMGETVAPPPSHPIPKPSPSQPPRTSSPSETGEAEKDPSANMFFFSPALQGHVPVQPLPLAQITLSTPKIFKFRTFSLFLELNSAYVKKNKLTEDDILKAGIAAKCYKESAPDQELVSCSICSSKKRIIELAISNKAVFGPKRSTYGTETYTFDVCKTNCSSSRDHHKSHLLIVIDGLPGLGAISSMPFIVQAREKQQGGKKLRNKLAGAPMDKPPGSTPSQEIVPRASVTSGLQAPPQYAPSPERVIHVEMKVKVSLASSTLESPELEKLVKHFRTFLARLPGYIQYKFTILPGLAVGFSFFDTEEHHMQTSTLVRNYMHNINGVNNLLNCDLVENGICLLLAICTSW
ncbi:hypothetical protein Pelo_734 [Pelomyxa schiedti]|nr:hypothetical protein Pelo_734 [Pelomyxa schiedti]